ncbi:MAG: nitroreductase family protein [Hadesarchaea archaeon]|nr:nitroreductase family protein [Hadesarchaea archaeon]MDH5685365.1 nitroreductase family protein [Hadesarchaea archaeon]
MLRVWMDVFEAIKGRRSVREFRPDPIKEGDLKKILEAAQQAPSAGHCQPLEMVVVKDQAQKERLARAALGQTFIAEAPVAIVVCADVARTSRRYGRRGEELYCIQDTAAATQNIHLAAYALGYATCWIGAFDEGAVAKVIKAPAGVRPLAIVPIGKPAEKPSPPQRIPLSKIVREERF